LPQQVEGKLLAFLLRALEIRQVLENTFGDDIEHLPLRNFKIILGRPLIWIDLLLFPFFHLRGGLLSLSTGGIAPKLISREVQQFHKVAPISISIKFSASSFSSSSEQR
jgi:hypothetical protein